VTRLTADRAVRSSAEFDAETAQDIRQLYVVEGWSIRRIADHFAISRPKVAGALRQNGVEIAIKGAGRPRPKTQGALGPGLQHAIVQLYVERRLTRAQVARTLEITEHRVRECLRALSVRPRSRGRGTRQDRQRVALSDLEALYVDAELPADAVAARIGATRGQVLATAHEQGVPVRVGGPANNARSVELLAALYSDAEVVDALHLHGVSLRRQPGSITERFPRPSPLSVDLLEDLYLKCGLSTTQIELVTGQAAATVRRHLRESRIPIRAAGGLAPFTRRVRRALPTASKPSHRS